MRFNRLPGLITAILFASLLPSCASVYNVTSMLPEVFETGYLNDKTSVLPIDLRKDARCPDTLPLRVANKETRTDLYMVYDPGGLGYAIVPSEYMNTVARYMEDKLRESNVAVDQETGKEVDITMEEVRAEGSWTFGCDVKLKIVIPEINYTGIYAGHEGGATISDVIGYATNLAIAEFLKDPIVQKYIRCAQ